jgi:class 3 adenylate cyclase
MVNRQIHVSTVRMQSLEHWLMGLGLGHLAPIFKSNGIDIDVVQELTTDDLIELGLSLGDRKRFLKAIGQPSQVGSTAVEATAERRQITVLFCDLVGSSKLAATLDPEVSRDIIREYRRTAAVEIERRDGHIAQYLGDGILAYFGWPTAHEDAAARAVSAALEMPESVLAIRASSGHRLDIRIGIASGLVVVGATDNNSKTEDFTAVGDAVNIAARLQDAAQPGQVLIANSTRLLLKGQFDIESLGALSLKGIVEPVESFRAKALLLPSRQQVVSKMTGREDEMRLALNRWDRAKAGAGQILFITGEAGIGKSHMTEQLIQEISTLPVHVNRYVCLPFQQSTALHPVAEQLRHEAGITHELAESEAIEKLSSYLEKERADIAASLPYLCRLLNLQTSVWAEPEDTTPMVRKARVFTILHGLVKQRAENGPVLVVVEDAHWIDPTTYEFLEQLASQTRDKSVMILVNGRPEFDPQWQVHGNMTTLNLHRLSRANVDSIAIACGGRHIMSQQLLDKIAERSDGIPLFIEELTKAMLESRGDQNPVPTSLRDILTARLERIPGARLVAQIAACIGRECDHALLAAIVGKTGAELAEALGKLEQAEVLFRTGVAPDATYRFKHALVQEAAAESLLKSKRRNIHHQIARHLEKNQPGFAKARPEFLAYQFAQAEEFVDAIQYHKNAGELAATASGNFEAIGEYSRALKLLTLIEPSADRDKLELGLLVAMAIPTTLIKGYAAPEVEDIYKRAMETAARLPNDEQNFSVIYGFWRFYLLRGDYTNAMQLSRQLLNLSQDANTLAMEVTSHRAAGATRFYTGKYESALEHLGQTARIQPTDELRKSILSYDVVDPWVVNYAYSGMALWLYGKPEEAIASNDAAIAIARSVNHPFTLALALCFAQWTHQFNGDKARVKELSREALALSSKYGFTFWIGWAEMMLAWAEAGDDDGTTRTKMYAALQLWQSTGSRLGLSYFQFLLAEQSEGAEAKVLLDAAEKFALEHDELFWLPEILRQRGHLLLNGHYDDADEQAAKQFQLALECAEKLEARGLATRAKRDLAMLTR